MSKKEQRVYWLNIKENKYDFDLLKDLEKFISTAENIGNVATIEHFINEVLNSDNMNSLDYIFILV